MFFFLLYARYFSPEIEVGNLRGINDRKMQLSKHVWDLKANADNTKRVSRKKLQEKKTKHANGEKTQAANKK